MATQPTSKNLKAALGIEPVVSLPDELPEAQQGPNLPPLENSMAAALEVLGGREYVDDARDKRERVVALKAELKQLDEDVKVKQQELQDVTAALTDVGRKQRNVRLEIDRLEAKTDQEVAAEYFAAQRAERETRAEHFKAALAAGLLTPEDIARSGLGQSPIDRSIAARNRSNPQNYLSRQPVKRY
jgi:hypothetical protein